MTHEATKTQIATATLVQQLGEQLNALRAERDAAVAERDSKQEVVEAAWETLGSLRAENARLREALEDLIDAQVYAVGWDNGVTDSTGTINEGAHFHALVMDRARAALHPKEETP